MKLSWDLQNAVLVDAPAWRVWQCLCDVLHWPSLAPLSLYGRPLALREKFAFTIRPLGLPIKVKATVSDFRALQVLGWQGKFLGISSQVKIRLQTQANEQTMLFFEEKLDGFGLLFFSAIFSMKRLVEINQEWLTAIARQCNATANFNNGTLYE